MPVLSNAAHELFAQKLAEGLGITEAYEAAGYKHSPAAATRLSKKVKDRVEELKAAGAALSIITIADIAKQLDDDRTFARTCKQPGAAVSATLGKAKVLGLMKDKIEHTGKDGGAMAVEVTDGQAARLIAYLLREAKEKKAKGLVAKD